MNAVTITIALSHWLMQPFGFDCVKPVIPQQMEMKIPEKRGPRQVPPPFKPGKEREAQAVSTCPCHKQKS